MANYQYWKNDRYQVTFQCATETESTAFRNDRAFQRFEELFYFD